MSDKPLSQSSYLADPSHAVTTDQYHRLLSAIVNASEDAILSKTLDGVITSWNPAAERIFGYSADEILGKPKTILFPPERLHEEAVILERLRNGQSTEHFETLRLRKDGTIIDVSVTISPIKDEHGEVLGASTIARDITERKQSEQAVQLLSAVVTASDDAIMTKTLDGIITSWNAAAESMFGYSANEIIGKSKTVLLPHDRLQEESVILEDLRRGQSTHHFETVRVRKDGTPINVSVTISPIRDNRSTIIGASTIARDITSRLKEEEQIRLLSTVATESISGIIVTDPEERIQYVNPAFVQISGFTLEELRGRRPAEVLQGPDTEIQARRDLRAAIKSQLPISVEITNYHKNGRPYVIEMHIAPVHDREGRLTHFVAVENDITARRQQELALSITMMELECRNNELIEARDLALSATRAKSEFLANMSHEIRTPLNGVIGIAELLSYTPLDANQQSFMGTLRNSAQGLLGIINDILDFSKSESGKLTVESIPFSLRDAMEEAATLLATRAHEKGVEICCIQPPLGTIEGLLADQMVGDPTRLKQIITNLVSNAIKFTDTGEIVLRTQLLSDSANKSRWLLSVTDTGIGVPPDRLSAIFESFTQVDGSTTRRFGGTGLGLTISRQLTTLMGGEITLLSEVGKGSEFRVDITFQKLPTTQAVSSVAHVATTGRRILVIDDNACSRESLRELLGAWGHDVSTVSNAAEAVGRLRESPACEHPDLILTDMPPLELTTRELGSQLRGIRGLAVVPIVLLGSIGAPGVAQAMSTETLSACLCKPVRQTELLNVLQRVTAPLADPISVEDATEPELDNGPAITAVRRLSLRILFAEDEPVNQLVGREMMKRCGIAPDLVTTVGNGRDALSAWERGEFDLILMDVQMPEMDGWETTLAIRARENERDLQPIPIFAMTGHVCEEYIDKSTSVGMNGHITKPFTVRSLMSVLVTVDLSDREPIGLEKDTTSSTVPAQLATLFTSGMWDNERLAAATGGDVDIEVKILREYLKTAPKMLSRCIFAAESEDASALEHWAHTLKGSSRTVGADRLAEICLSLEKLGKENRVDLAAGLLASANEEWAMLYAFLQERLGEPDSCAA